METDAGEEKVLDLNESATIAALRAELAAAREAVIETQRDCARIVQELEERVNLHQGDIVPLEIHERVKREGEARINASNDRMVALDRRFRELWRDMRLENGQVREAVDNARKAMQEERQLRLAAETRVRQNEAHIIKLTRDNLKLQSLLKQAEEKASLMRTIARIREETDDAETSASILGFDGLVKKIRHVSEEVERQVTFHENPTR